MRLRACIVAALVFAMLIGMAAYSAGAESVYPGSKLVFDMNITEQDFLPALKKALPGMTGIIGTRIPGAPQGAETAEFDAMAKEVVAALDGLKSVSVAYFELAGVDAAKLTQFYAPKIGLNEGWNPVVRMMDPKGKGSFRLYVKPDLEEIFGLASFPTGYVVVHTTGKIDATRLAELAAKAIPQIMSSRQPVPQAEPAPTTEPAPEPTPEPTPEPSPTPEPAPEQPSAPAQ